MENDNISASEWVRISKEGASLSDVISMAYVNYMRSRSLAIQDAITKRRVGNIVSGVTIKDMEYLQKYMYGTPEIKYGFDEGVDDHTAIHKRCQHKNKKRVSSILSAFYLCKDCGADLGDA